MPEEQTKRGRKAASAVESSPKVDSPKKRGRPSGAKPVEEDAPVAKRGRGRPKGSTKKVIGVSRKPGAVGGRRGRPRKSAPKPPVSSEEDDDDSKDADE